MSQSLSRSLLLFLALASLPVVGCASRTGDQLALEGNLAGALDVYGQQDTYDAHLKMGMLHQTQGNHHDAIAHFTRAMPRNAEADYRVYQYRAESYLATGDIQKARADIEEALRRNPRTPQVHFLMGNIHFKADRLDHARASYTRALEEAGSHNELKARILKNRALVNFHSETYMNAAEDYRAAVDLLKVIQKEDRYNLGLLLYAAGRETEAQQAWSGLSASEMKRLSILLDKTLGPGM